MGSWGRGLGTLEAGNQRSPAHVTMCLSCGNLPTRLSSHLRHCNPLLPQVESFLLVLQQLLPWLRSGGASPPPPSPVGPQAYSRKLRVVEFGSGSGNLLLPLAWALPGCR